MLSTALTEVPIDKPQERRPEQLPPAADAVGKALEIAAAKMGGIAQVAADIMGNVNISERIHRRQQMEAADAIAELVIAKLAERVPAAVAVERPVATTTDAAPKPLSKHEARVEGVLAAMHKDKESPPDAKPAAEPVKTDSAIFDPADVAALTKTLEARKK